MRTLLAIALLLATPAAALANDQGYPVVRHFGTATSGTYISGTLDESSHVLTVDLTANGNAAYTAVAIDVSLDYTAASQLQFVYACSLDGTTFGTEGKRDTGGTPTHTTFTETVTAGADVDRIIRWGVAGCKKFRLTATDTGGGASDTLVVTVTAIAGS